MRSDYYVRTHPRPQDVYLLVEVSDTTGEYDRTVKIPLYARAGIPEVWVVDLVSEAVDVHRRPGPGGGYQHVQRFSRKQSLAPEAFPDLLPSIDEIFG